MLKQSRQALHAGSWYSKNRKFSSYLANDLNTELTGYLEKAKRELDP